MKCPLNGLCECDPECAWFSKIETPGEITPVCAMAALSMTGAIQVEGVINYAMKVADEPCK